MVLAMVVMYVASGIHWSVNIYTFMLEIQNPVAWVALPIQTRYRWSVITTAALFYNVSAPDLAVERAARDSSRYRKSSGSAISS